MQEGDVIVQWGEKKLDSVYDLTDELRRAKPGETVKLRVKRGGEELDVEATLAEPRR